MLELAMRQVKAQELLEDPVHVSRLNTEGVYRLLLRAGWPVKEAQKAANVHGFDRLSAGENV